MKKFICFTFLFFALQNIGFSQNCAIITEPPVLNAGVGMNTTACQNTANTIQLSTLLTGADNGGVWSLSPTSPNAPGAAFDSTIGQLTTKSLANGIYAVVYTVGSGTCTDSENVEVLIQNCCPPKICTGVIVTKLQ